MKTIKGFLVLGFFLGLVLGCPVPESSGCGCGGESQYIIGNVHSNEDVNLWPDGHGHGCGCKSEDYWVYGDVSAVGNIPYTNPINGTITPGASAISIPEVDFVAFEAAHGTTITAYWGSSEIKYVDGDVSINLASSADRATYGNKTVVATGNISVSRSVSSSLGYANMNLIAQGSVSIDLTGYGHSSDSASLGVTGLIYAQNGVDIHVRGSGGCHTKVYGNIKGMVMAKDSGISVDAHNSGHSSKSSEEGVEYENVVTPDLLKFFKIQILTYWREIRG